MSLQYLILDLDNTLYPKSSGMLQSIDARIDEFIAESTQLPPEQIAGIRYDYFKRYGTTIGGMVVNHGTDPDAYFRYAYDVQIDRFIKPDPELRKVLEGINLTKVVFSNSPLEYVENVLRLLGVRETIAAVYDIRFCNYMGKPDPRSYQKVLEDLGAQGGECIFVDDVEANLYGAAAVGITPVLLGAARDSSHVWQMEQIYDLKTVIPEIMKARLSA